MSDTPPIVAMLRRYGNSLNVLQTDIGADFRHAADTIEALLAALDYVCERTCIGTDAEWHFKPGYDPQRVIDAIAKARGQS
jgi:hypothetical protein